eukprot:GHVS01024275.1.p1 GENE.GHVS01024275.1~~GHVS01024275.1.p1  ORF type:complete len:353 (-),score=90.89 GHVS01024275.1:121-1179(-)
MTVGSGGSLVGSGGMPIDGRVVGGGKHVPKCFDILPFASVKCRVHPVVVFTILDGYVRREDDQCYVIGTLMGIVFEGNVVEVTDCFVDRHSLTETGLLQIIKDHHESMFELKQKVNPKEQVVGWFCTGAEMTELTCAVHGWFKSFSSVSKFQSQPPLLEPIHLMVDTTLSDGNLSIQAFMQVPMTLVKEACFQFQQIPMEMHTSHAEKAGMSVLLKARRQQQQQEQQKQQQQDIELQQQQQPATSATAATSSSPSIPPLKDGFEASLGSLQNLLLVCRQYVEGVLDGTATADSDLGRLLVTSLCAGEGNSMDSEHFEKMCQTSVQDTLMVSYLASLARLQFAVAEKLNTSFF